MRPHAAVLLALLLALPPAVQASSPAPVSASGPDGDGAFLLAFDVPRASAGDAAVALDVMRDDAGALAGETRDLGRVAFEAGTTRWSASYQPGLGAGTYRVRLLVDGDASAPLTFDVLSDGGSQRVPFDVPDAPTYLNLTSDAVNANGKLKAPGEEVVTRATLSDGNGVGDVDRVVYRVERPGWADSGVVRVPGDPANTTASLELRYARSPLANATYTLTLLATRGGATVASVSRTFTIKAVAPTVANATLPPIVPDAAASETVPLVLLGRNGPAPPPELRIYKGSARAEPQGFRATLGDASVLPDDDGSARVSWPLQLDAPANATVGAYRVSAYENGSLVGLVPFDVLPLPTLADVAEGPSDEGTLLLVANVTGHAFLVGRLADADGSRASTVVETRGGASTVALLAPSRASALAWSLEMRAHLDGPVLAWRNGTWARDLPTPRLQLAGSARTPGRLPAAWTFEAPGWDLRGARGNVTVLRWDGAIAPVHGSFEDGAVRVEGAPDLEAGRYQARLAITLPNGTVADVAWTFDAAPWLRLRLGEPNVTGREARLSLRNDGGVEAQRLVVELEGGETVTLERAGHAIAAQRNAAGRFVFASVALAPGEEATLVVRLPDGPLRAGPHPATVRVLALAGASGA